MRARIIADLPRLRPYLPAKNTITTSINITIQPILLIFREDFLFALLLIRVLLTFPPTRSVRVI